jgi:SAM-dependent methyltransferase
VHARRSLVGERHLGVDEPDRGQFVKGHIEDIPLPDAAVDVVISNCVINLSVDKPAVLAQMFRVLSPGGRIDVPLDELHVAGAGPGRVRPGRAYRSRTWSRRPSSTVDISFTLHIGSTTIDALIVHYASTSVNTCGRMDP